MISIKSINAYFIKLYRTIVNKVANQNNELTIKMLKKKLYQNPLKNIVPTVTI